MGQRRPRPRGRPPDILAAALDAIAVPAFVFEVPEAVLLANAPGRQLQAADPAGLRRAFRGLVEGDDVDDFEVTVVAGPRARRWYLATRRARAAPAVGGLGPAVLWKLTPRELEVAQLVATGLANKEIAVALDCSVKAVEMHVTSVLRKSGAKRRLALIALLHGQNAPDRKA